MPAYEPPTISPWCEREEHSGCDHAFASSFELAPRRFGGGAYDVFCRCPCHADCPLAGHERTRKGLWEAECTCPGAVPARARRAELMARLEAERADRKQRMDAALAGVNVGHGRSKTELKAEFTAAFRRHDVKAPEAMLDVAAEALSAVTGPRLLAPPRLGLLGGKLAVRGARAAYAGIRFLREYQVKDDD